MNTIAIELHSFVDEERNKMKNKRSILQNFIFIAIVSTVFFLLLHFVLGVVMVQGVSMGNTVSQSSVVFYNRLASSHNGDIVIAQHGNDLLIKRQIATGGQTVDIVNGKVSVDGVVLSEAYLSDDKTSERDVAFPYTIPADHVFLLGDNRAASVDSRNSQIGSIENSNVVGKVMFIK